MDRQVDDIVSELTTRAVIISNRIRFLEDEIRRLKTGDFTPEELQNLCHNLPEKKKEEFFKGCSSYQDKLFRCNAVDEEMERCIKWILIMDSIPKSTKKYLEENIREQAKSLRG